LKRLPCYREDNAARRECSERVPLIDSELICADIQALGLAWSAQNVTDRVGV